MSAKRFVAAARACRYEALWLLLLFGGPRIGEALGLTWDDVDLDQGVIHVRQQLVELNGHATIAKLKTKKSRRSISLGPMTVDALRRTKRISKFVFVTVGGSHPRRSNLRQREFAAVLEAAGITDVSFHELRHSMTSLADDARVPSAVTHDRLGHTRASTTQTYTHALAGADRLAAAAIEAVVVSRPRKQAVKKAVRKR